MGSDFIVMYRVGNEGQLQFVLDDDGDVAVFGSSHTAQKYADENRLFQSGQARYQIIEPEI